jgi:hypothetical protein
VVRHLVHDGGPDLVHGFRAVTGQPQQRPAEDRDGVGEPPRVAAVPLGERRALVQPEEVRVLGRRLGLDEDDDVVHDAGELGWQRVQRLGHQLFELIRRHRHHARSLPGKTMG